MQDWGGEWWEYSFEMALTRGSEARALSAFFAALGGMRGRFLFEDPSAMPLPDTGAPVVLNPGQSGTRLETGNWMPNRLVMRAGDLFSLGSDAATRLYQVTADAHSAVTGVAMLQIVPRLRRVPLANEMLEIARPRVALRLTGPVPTRIGRADTHRFTVNAREALLHAN